MLSRLKSLPLTIVLTILIWMYAEAQFTSTRENVRVTVSLLSPSPDYVVRALDAQGNSRADAAINVTLQGPKDRIDRIFAESQNATAPDEDFSSLSFVVPLSSVQNPATHTPRDQSSLDSLEMLNSLPYFRQRGVTITQAVPARIKLAVDTLEHLPRTIDFRPAVSGAQFTLAPEQVVVNIPSRTLQEIGGPEKLTVIARPQIVLASLPLDKVATVPVRYAAEYPGPQDDRVTITPPVGKAMVRLPRRQGITEVVPEVPVWVAGPPAMIGRYDVEMRPKFVRVTVTGTAAVIGQLRQRMTAPLAEGVSIAGVAGSGIRAYLDIVPDDRASEIFASRPLRYVLPDGLAIQEAPVDVEFRLTARKPPATQKAPVK